MLIRAADQMPISIDGDLNRVVAELIFHIREKAIKEWKRAWKIRLIQEANPEWNDLYDELL